MDSVKINSVEENVNELLTNLSSLKNDIRKYKAGSESFSEASDALKKLTEKHESLVIKIGDCIEDLSNLDPVKLLKECQQLSERLDKLEAKQEQIQEAYESSVNALLIKIDEGFTTLGKQSQESAKNIGEKLDAAISESCTKLSNANKKSAKNIENSEQALMDIQRSLSEGVKIKRRFF